MRVRIHLHQGPRLKTKHGHDPRRRAARQLSNWFTQAAIFGYAMTVWKYGYDLGRVREFVIGEGWMAHWQAWGALSLAAHAFGVPLRHYSERRVAVQKAAAKTPAVAIPIKTTRPASPQPIFSVSSSPRPRQSSPAPLYRAG